VDNRFAAYKVLGNQIKETTPAQRDAFVDVFTEYMVSSYADALGEPTRSDATLEGVA
jgi:phospholipid transport system substrate-binding protein